MQGWLATLANRISSELIGADVLAPVGCHHTFDTSRDVHELTLFPGRTETVGGECDGRRTGSAFYIDVHRVTDAFDIVAECYWQSARVADDDELGAHLSIEGTVGGHVVWVRILQNAPERFPTARIADAYDGRLVEVW